LQGFNVYQEFWSITSQKSGILIYTTVQTSKLDYAYTRSVRKVSDLWPGKRNWLTWSIGHL